MKAKLTGPRMVGQQLYEVDRPVLITVFAAGAIAGAILVILASRYHNRARS